MKNILALTALFSLLTISPADSELPFHEEINLIVNRVQSNKPFQKYQTEVIGICTKVEEDEKLDYNSSTSTKLIGRWEA